MSANAKVQKLEMEIKRLNQAELAELRQWFYEFEAEVWDSQIEKDMRAGKLDAMALEALEEYRAGKAKKL